MINLDNISATSITKLIHSGQISSKAVVEHFIKKIEQVNPTLNAIVIKLFENALKEADRADALLLKGERIGRLHGLPFTIKECLDLVGTPSTFGLLRRRGDTPQSTDLYVEALQKEGGIVIGKTNVSQLLATIESQNPVYGTTNNPFSKEHSSGGSSGGEGAIISAGGSPIGLGTDIGGSVRIPASFNGICAIKPTNQRTLDKSRFLDRPLDLPIPSVTGILANHAEDLHLFLDIMNDTNGNEKVPLKNFADVECSKLKVGYMLTDNLFEPAEFIKRGVLESVEKMESLGAETTLFDPPNLAEAEELYTKVLSADGMPLFSENLKDDKLIPLLKWNFLFVKSPEFIRKLIYLLSKVSGQSVVRRVVQYFSGSGPENMKQLRLRIQKYKADYLSAMDNSPIGKLDAIICPVFPLPAILHNTADKIGLGGAYTLQNNLTGFPAGVANVSHVYKDEAIPRKKSLDLVMRTAAKIEKQSFGLPIGIQVIARPWNDHIVIALIEKLHRIQPLSLMV